MGNNITDWVIQKWVFPLPGAYQSFPDLYLSLITFLILLAATLVELCQNLFPSVSWFSLNAWDFHLPSPVPVPGSWELHFKAVPPSCCNPLGCDGGSSGSANCMSMGCSDRMKVCAGPLMSLTKVLAPQDDLTAYHYSRSCPTHSTHKILAVKTQASTGGEFLSFAQTLMDLFSSVLPSNPGKQTTCTCQKRVPPWVMFPTWNHNLNFLWMCSAGQSEVRSKWEYLFSNFSKLHSSVTLCRRQFVWSSSPENDLK